MRGFMDFKIVCVCMEKRCNQDKSKYMPSNAVYKFNFGENESGPSLGIEWFVDKGLQ